MTQKKHQRSDRLIDLGAATTVTKGQDATGNLDEPASQRQKPMSLNAD